MFWRRLIIVPLCGLLVAAAPLNFVLDSAASSVSARVGVMGVASKTVRFTQMAGSIRIDPENLRDALIDVTIDANEVQAPDRLTLRQIRSESFFWVERYPTMRFVGTSLAMHDATHGVISGNLTARGVTRHEELRVTFNRPPEEALMSGAIALTGEMEIDRRDYGMRAMSLVVGHQVQITMTARMLPR